VLRQSYVGAAHVAAAAFARIPGVTAVLATGSVTRPEILEPGASDIDLLLVVDVPTVEAELVLRSRLRRVHRALHGVAPVLTNLDYVEERDIDLLRAFGTSWSVDLDRRFTCLAGRDPRTAHTTLVRPKEEVLLEHAVHSVKRWMRASSFLLDPRVPEPQKPRTLRRLLSDLLAQTLHRDRLTPYHELVREAQGLKDAGLLGELPEAGAPSPELGLAAALESTSKVVTSVAESWGAGFRVETEAPRPNVTENARAFAALAGREGFSAGVVPRGPERSGALAVALAPAGDGPLDLVRRATRLFARATPLRDPLFAWLPRPVVVHGSWLRSAALWGNAPLAGAAMGASAVWLNGAPPPLPVAPPDDVIRALVRARMMKLFVRRVARTARDAQAFEREQEFEARSLRPALAHALDTGAFRLAAPDVEPCTRGVERDDLAALREWLEGGRGMMADEATSRRRHG
jgi:hypothetical protein